MRLFCRALRGASRRRPGRLHRSAAPWRTGARWRFCPRGSMRAASSIVGVCGIRWQGRLLRNSFIWRAWRSSLSWSDMSVPSYNSGARQLTSSSESRCHVCFCIVCGPPSFSLQAPLVHHFGGLVKVSLLSSLRGLSPPFRGHRFGVFDRCRRFTRPFR